MNRDILGVLAATTVFAVMFALGLGIALRELPWASRHPGLVARALLAVLVVVPVAAVTVGWALDLPRPARIGIALMAVAPGAPVALRRSLSAGGHHAFAPMLQVLLALLAVASMPLSIAALDWVYDARASLPPTEVARQVFLAQLMPLGCGMLIRHLAPGLASRIEPWATRLATVLLVGLLAAIAFLWRAVVEAGPRTVIGFAAVTAIALAAGHALGGPDANTRTAVAVSSAARNPGLALLVATLNQAPPEIGRVVLAYMLVSGVLTLPYFFWRRRQATRGATA